MISSVLKETINELFQFSIILNSEDDINDCWYTEISISNLLKNESKSNCKHFLLKLVDSIYIKLKKEDR